MADIRFLIRDLVNDVRSGHGLLPLHLHEELSAACKAHAEHMLRVGEAVPAPSSHLGEWREHNLATGGEGTTEALLEKVFLAYVHGGRTHPGVRKMLEAREFVAADVAVRLRGRKGPKEVYLSMRFK